MAGKKKTKKFEPHPTNQAEVGDVVTSPAFVYAGTGYGGGELFVTGIAATVSELASGIEAKKWNQTDSSRASAWFVVEEAAQEGSGSGCYWKVRARRLTAKHTYDPKGELITFVQWGNYVHMVPTVQVVHHMKRTVTVDFT